MMFNTLTILLSWIAVVLAENETHCDSCRQRLDRLEAAMQHMLQTSPLSREKDEYDKRSDDDNVVQILGSKVAELEAQLTALHNELNIKQGSVYIRWGHTACPASAEMVYTGFMGGSRTLHDTGSGANLLCLPNNPVYDNLKRTTCGPSTIYGAEYEVCPDPHHNMDIVCSLCRTPRTSSIMIPATNVCPSGWTQEYAGHMMAGYGGYAASTDYVCVDQHPQDRPGGQADANQAMLYYTVSKCGSLPCPPYVDGKILSCVVCSK